MATATKAAKHPVQELAMRAITVDHDLQSRVATSVEYQREFSEAMLRGDVFPPITVFFDGTEYWLADGFHRLGAAKATGLTSIRAEVVEGSRREAAVYSAGANQKFSIPRTKEDIKKAVWMLLADEDWFHRTASMIGKHVGVSQNTAAKYRVDYCAQHGIPEPKEVLSERGHRRGIRHTDAIKVVTRPQKNARNAFYAKVGTKEFYLGATRSVAQVKLAEIDSLVRARNNSWLATVKSPSQQLSRLGFSFNQFSHPRCANLKAQYGHDALLVLVAGDSVDDCFKAVGRLLMLKTVCPGAKRFIVLLRTLDGQQKAIGNVASDVGVEFMTLVQMVEDGLSSTQVKDVSAQFAS